MSEDTDKLVANMSPTMAEQIYKSLLARKAAEADILKKGVCLTPKMAAAADPRNVALLRQVNAMCGRVNYRLVDDERVDLVKLNACLKESGASVESRMRLKEALHFLHLIEN
jgi:hypothetical protein